VQPCAFPCVQALPGPRPPTPPRKKRTTEGVRPPRPGASKSPTTRSPPRRPNGRFSISPDVHPTAPRTSLAHGVVRPENPAQSLSMHPSRRLRVSGSLVRGRVCPPPAPCRHPPTSRHWLAVVPTTPPPPLFHPPRRPSATHFLTPLLTSSSLPSPGGVLRAARMARPSRTADTPERSLFGLDSPRMGGGREEAAILQRLLALHPSGVGSPPPPVSTVAPAPIPGFWWCACWAAIRPPPTAPSYCT